MKDKKDLLEHLELGSKVLKSGDGIKEAFLAIDRADFVPEDYKVEAYEDYPLPIGAGQTISQPTTVAFMLELLGAKKGENVLDVGSGSGWTTALLAHIVGPKGKVTALEIVPELFEFGKKNLEKYDLKNVELVQAREGVRRYSKNSPYDRILVSASAEDMPKEFLDELAVGGVIVIPVGESLFAIKKTKGGRFEHRQFQGFSFVPLK